jgi:hypothetical protein
MLSNVIQKKKTIEFIQYIHYVCLGIVKIRISDKMLKPAGEFEKASAERNLFSRQ